MREIKFRSWINIEEWKGYFYEDDKSNDYIQFIVYQNKFGVVDCNGSWLKDHEFSIEQFTGLQDKNGNDIYEGDIIRSNGTNKIIEFKNGSFGYKGALFYTCLMDMDLKGNTLTEVEIIGNIHDKETQEENNNVE